MRACKDCNDRVVGCHATCKRYAEETAQQEWVREQKRIDNISTSMEVERSIRKQKNVRSIEKRRRGY